MKILKFAFFAFLLTAVSNVFAQGNKTTYCYTWEPLYLPCVDEYVIGEVEECWTYFDNSKMQVKIKGELTGETSGSIYTLSQVRNINIQNWDLWEMDGSSTGTEVVNLSIVKDGMEIGVIKETIHLTINANGELTAEVFKYNYECY
jgi:hypothetical protein